MSENFRPKTLFEIFGGEWPEQAKEDYGNFIKENQQLLTENADLKHRVRMLEFEIGQYKKLIQKIQAQINSRETFNEKL